MYAQITLKMDRPINKNKHYISPGGYEVTLKDSSTIAFDFCNSEGYIDELDPSIITFDLHAEDCDAFPDMANLLDRYREIKSLSECYIHTGEHDDPEINVEQIINFTLIEKKTEPINNYREPESTSCINVRHDVISNTDDSITYITEYSFNFFNDDNNDTDNEPDLWSRYIAYLHEWANDHADAAFHGCTPACFEEWYDNEYAEEDD